MFYTVSIKEVFFLRFLILNFTDFHTNRDSALQLNSGRYPFLLRFVSIFAAKNR